MIRTRPKELNISQLFRSNALARLIPLRIAPGATLFGRWRFQFLHRSLKKRAIRIALAVSNVALLVFVIGIVVLNPNRSNGTPQPASSTSSTPTTATPVDQLASVDIALTVARMTNMLETSAVVSQANSQNIQLTIASTNSSIVDKTQQVSSTFASNKGIHTYVTQQGDTVSALAARFGVSSNSIMWSNGLTQDGLLTGQSLLIPPVNGLVYTVRAGDTSANLAKKFQADESKIIAYNDAYTAGLQVGEQVLIPDGILVVAPVYSAYSYASGFAWGSGAIYGFNGYDFGNCTWYVATQIAVPANWGNAATWAAGARAAGWHVSSVPTVGAIAQTPYAAGGFGHVAIVIAISGNQVEVRDMNDYGDGGGFDKVGQGWTSISTYPNYITGP